MHFWNFWCPMMMVQCSLHAEWNKPKKECLLILVTHPRVGYWTLSEYTVRFIKFKTELIFLRCLVIVTNFRCDVSLAHKEIAAENPQGTEEGRLYWSLASEQSVIHCCQSWPEGLPSSHRDEQEGVSYWAGHPYKGWQGMCLFDSHTVHKGCNRSRLAEVWSYHASPLSAESSYAWSGASSVSNMPLWFTSSNFVCLKK
jgi:hypothetical protein